jgi:tripeptide aminopeptidase
MEDIVAESSARNAIDTHLDCIFRSEPGGIPFGHPLVKSAVELISQLGNQPDQEHWLPELSELIAQGIPTVTLGIAKREAYMHRPDLVRIEPILTSVAQIMGVLLEIDRGACDEQ